MKLMRVASIALAAYLVNSAERDVHVQDPVALPVERRVQLAHASRALARRAGRCR